MKKFLLGTVLLYIICLLSFTETNKEQESFEKILQKHPERTQELLQTARAYQDTSREGEQYLSKKDILSDEELRIFRSLAKTRSSNEQKPVVIISTLALHELIRGHLKPGDSVVFYLGEYNSKDPNRIRRYNERNGGTSSAGESMSYTYESLKKRTAFAMQVFSEVPDSEPRRETSQRFTPGSFYLHPTKGQDEAGPINENQTIYFKKEAVTPPFEISRLCPPPREGCL